MLCMSYGRTANGRPYGSFAMRCRGNEPLRRFAPAPLEKGSLWLLLAHLPKSESSAVGLRLGGRKEPKNMELSSPEGSGMQLASSDQSKRRKGQTPFLLKLLLVLLNIDDDTALILTASLASTMGHAESTAVGALYDAGSGELPHGRPSLITSLSGYFSFWDCHVDTS